MSSSALSAANVALSGLTTFHFMARPTSLPILPIWEYGSLSCQSVIKPPSNNLYICRIELRIHHSLPRILHTSVLADRRDARAPQLPCIPTSLLPIFPIHPNQMHPICVLSLQTNGSHTNSTPGLDELSGIWVCTCQNRRNDA